MLRTWFVLPRDISPDPAMQESKQFPVQKNIDGRTRNAAAENTVTGALPVYLLGSDPKAVFGCSVGQDHFPAAVQTP